MSLYLTPFNRFYHPPAGDVVTLPITRDGVRQVPEGELVPSADDCLAELIMRSLVGERVSRCICGLVPAPAFLNGQIRGHERTLAARLHRQASLVKLDRGALGKPVLLTVRDLSPVLRTLDEQFTVRENTVRYRGQQTEYLLTERQPKPNSAYTIDLSALGTVVIADGHHRAETHARLAAAGQRSCDEVPVCLVDIEQLTIGVFLRQFPTYEKSLGNLLYSLAPFFAVSRVDRPVAPTEPSNWLMTYRGSHYRLLRRQDDGAYATPMAWFVDEVLRTVFHVMNPSTSDTLESVAVDVLASGLLAIPDVQVLSFAGSPIGHEQFFAEVEAGRTFPPKSTRFIPRVPSGLVVWKGC